MSEAQWGEGCGHYFMRHTWLEALRLETSPNTISSVFSVNVLISGQISSKTTGGKGGKNDSNARGQAGTITTINSEIVTNYGVKSRTIHFTTGECWWSWQCHLIFPLSTPTTITSHTQLHQSMSVSKLKCWLQERTIQRVNYGRDSANSTNSFSSSASSNRSVPDWEQTCEWCLTMFRTCNYSFVRLTVKQHCKAN